MKTIIRHIYLAWVLILIVYSSIRITQHAREHSDWLYLLTIPVSIVIGLSIVAFEDFLRSMKNK